MLRRTKISWADYSGGDLNFVIGCTPVSEGCANCYARAWAERVGRDFSNVWVYWEKLNRLWKAKWEPGDEPYRRGPGSKPIMFPCDLSDLFHEDVPEEMILTALDIFAARDDADWVLLTKRPDRMLQTTWYWLTFNELEVLPSNIWCLVTAENQRRADERIPILLQVKARVLSLSIEPMLEPIDLHRYTSAGDRRARPINLWLSPERLNWVIVGAESGPKRRRFLDSWAMHLHQQCRDAGVPFFFKQVGGLYPGADPYLNGQLVQEFPKLDK